jgi:hypothetical protein
MTRDGICLSLIAALWVLLGSYPLLLRMAYYPAQTLRRSERT